eukprot:10743265-Ditylum_brightwellii.AAC.1
MIASNINSESPLPQDEHTQVLSPGKSYSPQSSNTPLTLPTSKPAELNVLDELILMMLKMQTGIDNNFKERQQKHIDYFTSYLITLSSNVVSNKESLQKIKSNFNVVTQTISKLNTRLSKEKEIYSKQQKDISKCITKAENHVQNNKAIISKFDEKLDKTILNTKQ